MGCPAPPEVGIMPGIFKHTMFIQDDVFAHCPVSLRQSPQPGSVLRAAWKMGIHWVRD